MEEEQLVHDPITRIGQNEKKLCFLNEINLPKLIDQGNKTIPPAKSYFIIALVVKLSAQLTDADL